MILAAVLLSDWKITFTINNKLKWSHPKLIGRDHFNYSAHSLRSNISPLTKYRILSAIFVK